PSQFDRNVGQDVARILWELSTCVNALQFGASDLASRSSFSFVASEKKIACLTHKFTRSGVASPHSNWSLSEPIPRTLLAIMNQGVRYVIVCGNFTEEVNRYGRSRKVHPAGSLAGLLY